ncbi:MAG: hypothetical protein GYB42_05830, partial [Alphaproteobacteria bacterium]|nr:hypothetical protein [Alphaproteobacteria bacterium]
VFELIKNLHSSLKSQAAQTLMLMAWCHLRGEGAPDFDFVVRTGSYESIRNREKWSARKREHAKLLEGYGYQFTSDFDHALADFVRDGFVEKREFEKVAQSQNAEYVRADKDNSYHEAWKNFHCSFSVSEQQVVQRLVQAFCDNVEILGPTRLNQLVRFLRDLRADGQIPVVMQAFSVAHEERPITFWDQAEHAQFDIVWDPEVSGLMNEKSLALRRIYDVDSVVNALGEGAISPIEVAAKLKNADVDEIYAALMGTTVANHKEIMKGLLYYDQVVNASDDQRAFVAKVKMVLRRIGQSSHINRLRVARWGITIEDESVR